MVHAIPIVAICVVCGFTYLRRPGGFVSFPLAAAFVHLLFAVPQVIPLTELEGVTDFDLWRVSIMIFLSQLALWVGFHLGEDRGDDVSCAERPGGPFSIKVVAMTAVVGIGAYLGSREVSEEEYGDGQFSGKVTILLFFAGFVFPAFFSGLILLHRRPERLAWWTWLACAVALLDRILISAKRSTLISVIVGSASTLWFVRGYKPPLALVLPLLMTTYVFVNAIGVYRSAVGSFRTSELGWFERVQRGVTEVAESYISGETDARAGRGSREYLVALYRMKECAEANRFDYGLVHWNRMVKAFVPGSLIGQERKEGMMVTLPYERQSDAFVGYEGATGTALTGIVDCFRSFWYFGVVKFLAVGFIMGKLFLRSRCASDVAISAYGALFGPALIMITHHSQNFVTASVILTIFLWFNRMTRAIRIGG